MRRLSEKTMTCMHCKKEVRPILEKNTLKTNFYGHQFTGTEKKYVLKCPNCHAIIGSK